MLNYNNNLKIKVRYSQIDPDWLKEIMVEKYHFTEPFSCRFFDSGINDIYLVNIDNKNYYLRISQAGVHSEIDYKEEMNIINHLYKEELSVATPVCCKDGEYIWPIEAPEGIRYAVLFHEAINKPSEDNEKKAYNLGCELAKLHNIADINDFEVSREPISLTCLVDQSLALIKPHLNHRKDDFEFLEKTSQEIKGHIQNNLSTQKPFYGYCHGDIHSGNVFFDDNKPTIFDFDCMGYGYRVYDICVYAWNHTFDNEDYIDKDEWKAYIDGYNSIRQLSTSELELISAFAALRELWLIGLHADIITRNAGCCWYNDGYFDFQIGKYKLWYNRVTMK
jgi:Ser/Thr protein kinase RdoA (MazF antagonist)